MNAKMPALKQCFEAAGFTEVKTVLSSGNVVFNSSSKSTVAIERKAEAAMAKHLDRSFFTIVRAVHELDALIEADPFKAHRLAPKAKPVVTFVRKPATAALKLPREFDGARILAVEGREIFSAYVPSPRGPAFMVLIEKTFGKEVTTRTWETVKKCARA